MDVVTLIIQTIVSAFTTTLSGIGKGINDMFTGIFLTTGETGTITGLSPLAGYIFALLGLSLVLGILSKFLNRV